MMILLIDNYDSFVYNLARYVVELGFEMLVKRCDEISIEEIKALPISHLILSPGPGEPKSAGISMSCVSCFSGVIPILGVCLGHQAIAEAFGGEVIRAPKPVHGKSDVIFHKESGIFDGIPSPLRVGRYHSLVVSEQLPDCLAVIASNAEGLIMAIQHKQHPVIGVQFHPESILTQDGKKILQNFLSLYSLRT